MIKAEPRSILQFLASHFDLLQDLYELQCREEQVTPNNLRNLLEAHDREVGRQLQEYQILVPQNDGYVIGDTYFRLFSFVLRQFKPLLPEEIEKYSQAIHGLFHKIKQEADGDRELLLRRVDGLIQQIRDFVGDVSRNTLSLLRESRELKANNRRLDYTEKIARARFWIDHYIVPLNRILDREHAQSIFTELLHISSYASMRRLHYTDEGLRLQFERLYSLLRQALSDLQAQAVILSSELLPLMDRIQTESEYLRGFIEYLDNGNCFRRYAPPALFSARQQSPYSPFVYEHTRSWFEQFRPEEEVIIEEQEKAAATWIFDKSAYRDRLDADLPVSSFFEWCAERLQTEKEEFSADDFFLVTGLLFEAGYEVEADRAGLSHTIVTAGCELNIPQLKIKKNEDLSHGTPADRKLAAGREVHHHG